MLLFLVFFFTLCKSATWTPSISVDSGQSHTISSIYPGHYFITDNRVYFQFKYVITTTVTLTVSVLWNDLVTLPMTATSTDPTIMIGTSNPMLTTSESIPGGGSVTLVNANTMRATTKFASLGSTQVSIFVTGCYTAVIPGILNTSTTLF